MRLTKSLGGLALAMLVGAGFASCSNDLENPALGTQNSNLFIKAPKIVAYSGDQYWGNGNIFATRANGDNGVSWQQITTTALDLQAEAEYIDKKLPEGEQTIEGVDYDFIYYTGENAVEVEMFPVYMQTNKTQSFGIFYYDEAGIEHEEMLWEGFTQWSRSSQQWSQEQGKNLDVLTGLKINIPAHTTFGFFIQVCDYAPTDWSSEWNVTDRAYTTSSKNKESFNQARDYTTRIRAITWTENGKSYLGFEDWTDFDYQDLVFTMTPEVQTTDASTFVPGQGTPTPDENCDQCGHGSHKPDQCPTCQEEGKGGCYEAPVVPGDNCDQCGHESHKPDQCPTCQEEGKGGCYEAPEKPTTPPVVEGDNHTDEVEVNLGFDAKGDYRESHLSVHVRSAANVDLFIPMPLELICPADDMEIVKKHFEGEFEHGGEFMNPTVDEDGKVIMEGGLLSKMEYQIDQWTVTLYVEYVAAGVQSVHGETFAEEGIHIWSEGITQGLIDYLQENYQDGITFEIWNYYQDGADPDTIKGYLNQTTIKFLDKLPEYFINAFGSANYEEDKDCTVSIDDSQSGNYAFQGTGSHLNGSDKNDVFQNVNGGASEKPLPQPPTY